jgi:hypothetical protein
MKSSRGCVVWLAAVDEVYDRPGGDVRPMNKEWVQLGPGYSCVRPREEEMRTTESKSKE